MDILEVARSHDCGIVENSDAIMLSLVKIGYSAAKLALIYGATSPVVRKVRGLLKMVRTFLF
jgi:hypothetical protein